MFILGPLLDGTDQSFEYGGPLGEILDSVPSVDAVPQKIGDLLKAGGRHQALLHPPRILPKPSSSLLTIESR
jgi:hypothetical protein